MNNTAVACIVLLVAVAVLAPVAAPLAIPLLLFALLFAGVSREFDQASDQAFAEVETRREAVTHSAGWGCGALLLTAIGVLVVLALALSVAPHL